MEQNKLSIVTRAEAIENGLKRYFTGKPCPKGHISERSTNKSSCLACGKLSEKNAMSRTYPAIQIAEVARLYESGLSILEVASQLFIGRNKATTMLHQSGMAIKKPHDYPDSGLRMKIDIDLQALKRSYEAGETVEALSVRLRVGFGTVQRNLRAAGVGMRKNNWNQYDHHTAEWIRLYQEERFSLKRIAAQFGADYATIRRYLIENGIPLRADSSVAVYTHVSPCAGEVRVRGTWEAAYCNILDSWFANGRISGWSYENEKILLPRQFGSWYLPDFKVHQLDGGVVFHEIKGWLRERAMAKMTAARNAGHAVVLITGPLLNQLCRHAGIKIKT